MDIEPESKETIRAALKLIVKMLEDTPNAADAPEFSFDIPEIGNPARLRGALEARMKPLPFTPEEVETVQVQVEHAIETENRISQGVSRAAAVLTTVQTLIPKIAALAVGA